MRDDSEFNIRQAKSCNEVLYAITALFLYGAIKGAGQVATKNIPWFMFQLKHLERPEKKHQRVEKLYNELPFTQKLIGNGKEYRKYKKMKKEAEDYEKSYHDKPVFKWN